ncbi:hypothetical protein [Hominenteromicrobium sp.]|uniref:hypothetical protein n=1 Tax=Hominenteromicrobium sp. TaxID=3073581 RepID=UPI0039964CA3
MEEKAVLRVRDRISAALTVPYVRRAVWLMAGGLAGFLTARGLVFGKYAPFAAAGAAAAPFSTMWAVILGGAVGYLFPSPVDIPARYIAALLAVGAIRWSLSELKSIRDHPVFAPVTAFLPLLSTHRHGVFKRLAFKCARHVHCGVVFGGGHGVFSAPHRAAFGDPPRDRRV